MSPKAPRGTSWERPGWKAYLVLALGVLLFVAGGLLFVLQLDWSGERGGWVLASLALVGCGIACVVRYFDKWGKL